MSAMEESPDVVLSEADNVNAKCSINSYYARKVGLLHTFSLLLNAGLMVYAHLGLSGVIFSSLDPSSTAPSGNTDNDIVSSCNEQDEEIWKANGGVSSLSPKAEYCISTFNGGCFTNSTCTELCVKEDGYSDDCAICFGPLPQCGFDNGCTFLCLADSTSTECFDCLDPCIDAFYGCSSLPKVENVSIISGTSNKATGNVCNNFDLDAIEDWYNVYNLTFVGSVQDSWNNGAKMLSVIIVFFSGVWPYAKNVLLLVIWYVPMTVKAQTSGLLWLARLSKYTLVDVFAVIGVMVGVQLQLNIGGFAEAVIRAEPRFGIICFFLATVWEFLQIELMKAMHEKKVLSANVSKDGEERLLFSQLWIPFLLLLISVGLYSSGTYMEFLYIATKNYGSDEACVKSYNIYTFGNALINPISMSSNSAAGQTWFLYIVYVLLVLALPILTHFMQIIFIGSSRTKKLNKLIQCASTIWLFACIEVLLIGIFAVESKFEHFIKSVAGIENEGFLDIKSGLGNGFHILIAYAVVACFLQFSLGIRKGSSHFSQGKRADVDEIVNENM
mmetsp:Transcript_35984/g.61382  ORF Transcript_35984/g.61382 Transcript_35984/m.61382 type:complete len:556 (-) Transcript_35984:93-1760(-)